VGKLRQGQGPPSQSLYTGRPGWRARRGLRIIQSPRIIYVRRRKLKPGRKERETVQGLTERLLWS